MTNEPGLRMVVEKLKQQFESFLKLFNVSLGGQPQPQRQSSATSAAEAAPVYGEILLEIGNELMITDDIVRSYRGLSNSRGRVVIIDQIPSKDDSAVKASAFGIQVNVGIQEAIQMREAYLAWQQA